MTRRVRLFITLLLGCLSLLAAVPAVPAADAKEPAAPDEEKSLFDGLKPIEGPKKVLLGKEGQLDMPAGYVFLNAGDSKIVLERMRNIPAPGIAGMIWSIEGDWFAAFSYEASGYIEDTGGEAEIDADAILQKYKDSVAESNKEAKKRGWETSAVEGWALKPHYNRETKNLEWAMRFKTGENVYDNYNVRILGREGVMKVILAGFHDSQFKEALADTRDLLGRYSFVAGRTHAEFRDGDKVAGYGLAALVAGGGAAALAKSGLLTKFFKPIAIGAVAVFAFIANFFRRKKKAAPAEEAPDEADETDGMGEHTAPDLRGQGQIPHSAPPAREENSADELPASAAKGSGDDEAPVRPDYPVRPVGKDGA